MAFILNTDKMHPNMCAFSGEDWVPSAGHLIGGWVIFSPKNSKYMVHN